jgi:7-keto-8-aminopelargonate synthetase-like enzyme
VDQLKNALTSGPWKLLVVQSAILPIIVGEENLAVGLATKLRDSGIFIPAIRYPTVARGKARLRVTVTAAHTLEDLRQLAATLTRTHN